MSEQRARGFVELYYAVHAMYDASPQDSATAIAIAYAASEVARVREQTLRECLEMKPSEIAAAIRALPTEEP